MVGILSETQERFFKAITARLPLERIIELHLFQPIRQGGVESGVAVIAAVPEGEPLPAPGPARAADGGVDDDPAAGDDPGSLDPLGAAAADVVESALDHVVETESGELRRRDEHAASREETVEEVMAEPVPDEVADVPAEAIAEAVADVDHLETREAVAMAQASTELGDAAMDVAAAIAGAEHAHDDVAADAASVVAEEEPAAVSGEPAPLPRPRRYTVYTARYRQVLKGPDRGKWEVTVVAEADAPLLTVDVVVRGVLRRAGDAGEPERLTGDEVRRALRLPAATAAPTAAETASRASRPAHRADAAQ